ncbi:MAG: hypothetical protein ACLQNE_05260 [Thermoguttaceae bacterium]
MEHDKYRDHSGLRLLSIAKSANWIDTTDAAAKMTNQALRSNLTRLNCASVNGVARSQPKYMDEYRPQHAKQPAMTADMKKSALMS